MVLNDANAAAQANYEKSLDSEVKEQLYTDAMVKYRDDMEAGAAKELRRQIEELKVEVIAERRVELEQE